MVNNMKENWFGVLNRKFWEIYVYVDIILYHLTQIPWFVGNIWSYLVDTDHDLSDSKSLIWNSLFALVKTTVRMVDKILFGRRDKQFSLSTNIRYATKRPRQTLNEYVPKDIKSNRVIIFLHGGTWHSGSADLYHNFCKYAAEKNGYLCYCLNYTLFPKGYLEEMIEDVDRGVDFSMKLAEKRVSNAEFILVGHSAGAHLFSLVCQQKLKPIAKYDATEWKLESISKLVLLCGVYDMVTHYEYEKKRQVHIISPMWQVCKGVERFPLFSPSLIIDNLGEEATSLYEKWPKTVIAHGKLDVTCPFIQSEGFYQRLSSKCTYQEVTLQLLDQFYHGDLITNFMGIEKDTKKRDIIWNLITQ